MKYPTIFRLGAVLAAAFAFVACSGNHARLATVTHFKPDKYAGQWHEIARLPNFFERNVVAARATYGEISGSKKISVLNEGLKASGDRTRISGAATPIGNTPDGEAKLKVRFSRFPASLFAGDYWIIYLNAAHTRAIVGTPDRKYLWLLSKSPQDGVGDFKEPLKQVKQAGFEVDKLIVNPKRLD